MIPVYVLIVLFVLAAWVKLKRKEYAHAIPRLVIALYYLWLYFPHDNAYTHTVARVGFCLLAVVEIGSELLQNYYKRRMYGHS